MEIKKKMKMEALASEDNEDEIAKALQEFEQELQEEEEKLMQSSGNGHPSNNHTNNNNNKNNSAGLLGKSPNPLPKSSSKSNITVVSTEKISAQPVKYVGGQKVLSVEEEAERIAKNYEASLQKISGTIDMQMPKAPAISSYQDALKQADPQAKPKDSKSKYVFPQHAPMKKEEVEEQPTPVNPQKVITQRAVGNIAWEDPTLLEWRQDDYRIWVGDIGNDVTDEVLMKTFSKYPGLLRCRVVRDKKSGKTKGYAFVSFEDAESFTRALREQNGKYIGNRPCKLRKSKWLDRADLEALNNPYVPQRTKRNH